MARPRKDSGAKAPGTRAIVYLRVSKEDGPAKHGLEPQRASCRGYLAKRGYSEVAECIDDGVSGATPARQRKGLARAFRLCRAGQADVIVAYHQDRFARKMGVFDDIRDLALTARIRLETADGRILTHKDDFLTGDVSALVAAIERRRISERFYLARRQRSSHDGCGSGVVPFGYRREADGTLAIDEPAAAIVRAIFAGRERGQTYQTLADELNASGARTATGRQWSTSSVSGIERRAELYRSGVRRWDDVVADVRWPAILDDSDDSDDSAAAGGEVDDES